MKIMIMKWRLHWRRDRYGTKPCNHARLAFALLFALLCRAACALGAMDGEITLNIAANTYLEDALIEWGLASGMSVMINTAEVRHQLTQGVKGKLSARKALQTLLHDSGLTYTEEGGRVRIIPARTLVPSANYLTPGDSAGVTVYEDGHSVAETGGSSQSDNSTSSLSEVIVSAQKREERVQDVPIPVSTVNAATLVDDNLLKITEYYTTVPGLNVTPSTQSAQILSIRGITTGPGTNPTVGVVVDDVPYGSSTGFGGGLVVPDFDPSDLARIEVLRGPQGTLYGASSMGGLLKFVTLDPSTNGFSARVQGGVSGVQNGAEAGYNIRAAVNVPLADTLALRASAFTREDPGYIDNPVLQIDGINRAQVSGGHLSVLWRPAGSFSLKLGALYQNSRGGGSSDVDIASPTYPSTVGLTGLEQNYVRGAGAFDRTAQAYSAILTGKLGLFDVTSVTGYNINKYGDSLDYSYAYSAYAAPFGVTGVPVFSTDRNTKLTQEVRLSIPLDSRVDWLVGGFYTHENSNFAENIVAVNAQTGAIAGSIEYVGVPTAYVESAAFTDLTFHITDQFDIQLGGRESEISQTFTQTEAFGTAQLVVPEADTKASAFTYLVTPRYRISSDLMVYARLASGYRAGGANATATVTTTFPTQYDPDKTQDYDLGIKGEFLDKRLSIDAAVYQINWKDIQVQLLDGQSQQNYTTNGSRAKSQGIELSQNWSPLSGLSLTGWAAWNDAKLTEPFPTNSTAYGLSGDRLPYGSRFSANASVQQDFPIWNRLTGSCGASVSYVGEREGVFGTVAAPERQIYPAYSRVDLHAGVKSDSWQANLFVTNLTDRRGELTGGVGTFPPFAFTYIQPRTAGVTLLKEF